MFSSKTLILAGALASAAFAIAEPFSATAAPMTVASGIAIAPGLSVEGVRYRRAVRRDNAGAAAVLGLFGAVIGGAIANQRYDNYSNYAYGQPYDYGYAPGYISGPIYRGGVQRGFRGRGGFRGGRTGDGWRHR